MPPSELCQDSVVTGTRTLSSQVTSTSDILNSNQSHMRVAQGHHVYQICWPRFHYFCLIT